MAEVTLSSIHTSFTAHARELSTLEEASGIEAMATIERAAD